MSPSPSPNPGRGPVRRLPGAVAAILAGLLACTPAARALEGDEEQPMLIEADKVQLDEAQSTSVYEGNVQVDQGSMRLLADHVTVYHREDRRVRYLIALGEPAHYRQLMDNDEGEVLAYALRMDYDADTDVLVLIGDALLIQGEDRITSERIVYDRARERMRAGGTSRVKIRITPENDEGKKKKKEKEKEKDAAPPAQTQQ